MPISMRWKNAAPVICFFCFVILAFVPVTRAQTPPAYEVDPSWNFNCFSSERGWTI